jgi:hypothetical protein
MATSPITSQPASPATTSNTTAATDDNSRSRSNSPASRSSPASRYGESTLTPRNTANPAASGEFTSSSSTPPRVSAPMSGNSSPQAAPNTNTGSSSSGGPSSLNSAINSAAASQNRSYENNNNQSSQRVVPNPNDVGGGSMEIPKAEDEAPKAKKYPSRLQQYLPSAGFATPVLRPSDFPVTPATPIAEPIPITARHTPNNMNIPFVPNPNNVGDGTTPIPVAEPYQSHLEQSQSLPSAGHATPVLPSSNFPVAIARPIAEPIPINDVGGGAIPIPVAQAIPLQNNQDWGNPESFGFQVANPLYFGHPQAPQVPTNQQQQSTNANSSEELSNAEWLAGIVSNTAALSPQRQQDLFDAYVRDRNGNGNGGSR